MRPCIPETNCTNDFAMKVLAAAHHYLTYKHYRWFFKNAQVLHLEEIITLKLFKAAAITLFHTNNFVRTRGCQILRSN